MKALAEESPQECLVMKAFDVLKKQAQERHPGNKPEDIRLRDRLYDALREEYHTLKLLQKVVALAIANQADSLSLRAALKLSQLHTLILQDAFGRTASKFAIACTQIRVNCRCAFFSSASVRPIAGQNPPASRSAPLPSAVQKRQTARLA